MLRCCSYTRTALACKRFKRDLGEKERQRGFATQAYPKVRAKVLIRHKRLYLVCTDETHTLFMLPRASVCKETGRAQDKAGQKVVATRTISCPRTIVYVLTMIWVEVHEVWQDNKTR